MPTMSINNTAAAAPALMFCLTSLVFYWTQFPKEDPGIIGSMLYVKT